jgi:predicted PurR-regulated permease PerM
VGNIPARWIALLVVTGIALYLDWLMLMPFVGVLAWAAVLVIVFYPVHKRIAARMGSPTWSALLSSLLVIVAVLLPLTLITVAVVNEAAKSADDIQAMLAQGGSLLDPSSPTTGPVVRWIEQYVSLDPLRSQDALLQRLQSLSGAIASRTLGLLGGLLGGVVEVFFIIFTMYYMFRDGESIRGALYDILPLERAQAREIFMRTRDVVSASVYGVLVIALIQGALGGFAFWALGLPSALLWGVVMMLFSLIPMAGSFVVWVPAAIYLLLTGSYVKAGLLTVWGGLVIGSVDNFLRPALVGEKTRLHELLIFFSVLGGLQVFGVLGLVLGPVVVAVTLALLDVFRHADRPVAQTLQEPTLLEQQDELRNVPDEPADSGAQEAPAP